MRLISGLVVFAGLAAAPFAHAQVFKCTEADGKTVYSQAPCTKADNKEKVVKLMDAPLTDSASSETSDGRNRSYYQGANAAAGHPCAPGAGTGGARADLLQALSQFFRRAAPRQNAPPRGAESHTQWTNVGASVHRRGSKLQKTFQHRIGSRPHQAGFALGHRPLHAAVDHTRPLKLLHAGGHPGQAQPG